MRRPVCNGLQIGDYRPRLSTAIIDRERRTARLVRITTDDVGADFVDPQITTMTPCRGTQRPTTGHPRRGEVDRSL